MSNFEDDLNLVKRLTDKDQAVNIDFPECRGMSFKEFWEWLPTKLNYYDYWEEMYNDLEKHKHIWVKKCAGIGMTEFMLRWLAWKCLKDDEWKNDQQLYIRR